MKIVVTGAAEFIDYHFYEQLLKLGHDVFGLDNIDDYYDVNLEYVCLKELVISESKIQYNKSIDGNSHGDRLQFIKINLVDQNNSPVLFEKNSFNVVYNIANQAVVM
jgi:UDP-glucuronate 4-epimerase